MRRVPLAWLNLTHDRWRFVLFSLGIAFAVVLMFVQYGFRNALLDSNFLLIDQLNADLVMVSQRGASVAFRESFARHRLEQVVGTPGVRSIHPLYIEYYNSVLRNVDPDPDRRAPGRAIRVVGVDPDAFLLTLPVLDPRPGAPGSQAAQLKEFGAALFDNLSKRRVDGRESVFGPLAVGEETELAGRRIRLIGSFALGSDFAAEGTLIVSDNTFIDLLRRRISTGDPRAEVDLGLIRIAPGSDARAVQQAIRAQLPEGDVDVLTVPELRARESKFWLEYTPIGFVFGLGMGIGFIVGMVICYQILSGDVADHLAEYATLKAIGYPNRYLSGVVVQQALLMAGAGFLPGIAISWLIYRWLAHVTALPLRLTLPRAGLILALTLAMCAGSALLALRKAQQVDPAEVF